jgi:signal transduction histidine kinase
MLSCGLLVISTILIVSNYILLGTNNILLVNVSILAVLVCFNIVLFIYIFKIFVTKLEKISFAIDRVMDGEFTHVSDYTEDEEGMLSRLEFQFYQMGRRMQLNVENLSHEKENIKSLVADISHQIKTPLASIKMFNTMLLEDELTPKEREEFLFSVKNEVDKLEWLSNSLIKISRLETGVIQLKKETRDIRETIIQATNGVYLKAVEKNIDINLQSIPSAMVIHDVKWTQEAIFNVLDNAVKYTPENGRVLISMEKLETYVKIDIEDTGIGIKEEEIGQIFNRFYRGKSLVVACSEGSGIGLYLARRILEGQGGNIIVTSSEGEGSRFSILLTLQNCKE